MTDDFALKTESMIKGEYFVLTQEYWEGVALCKEQFVKYGKDPRRNSFMKREVAESWIRSKQFGVLPDSRFQEYKLQDEELMQIKEENKLLIDVASPLINNFLELATTSGHSLELFDINGVFLSGIHIKISPTPVLSVIWNESTTGTTAHGLAMHHNKLFQLCGPENYLDVLQYTIGTAAPICDENGQVIGALGLVHDLGPKPWEQNLRRLYTLSLGWVSSLTAAIENQMKLQKNHNHLREVNSNLNEAKEMLRVTLEFIDEGVMTIDADGMIMRRNREGSRLLNLDHHDKNPKNLKDFLTSRSSLKEVIASKKNVDFMEEFLKVGKEEKSFVMSIRPVLKPDTDKLNVAILRFNHSDKINALVNSRSGAVARFNFEDIVGESEAIKRAKKLACRFAESRENILLLGESGTGKELFAQAIHNQYRASGPFIAVNCAAMPRNLIESELFGYESGSFTGAEKNGRPGKIELANGGTLFLDEIGDMPYELQAVLLRVLQDKMVMRIGGRHYRQVQFRLITATNRNLYQMVQERKFREDLYFRLSVLNIEIPPLRERGFDIAILADYFSKNYAQRMGWAIPQISSNAIQKILEFSWPGNVRQLENAIIYAVNLAEDKMIEC